MADETTQSSSTTTQAATAAAPPPASSGQATTPPGSAAGSDPAGAEAKAAAEQARASDGKFAKVPDRLKVKARGKEREFVLTRDEDLRELLEAAEFGLGGKSVFTDLDRRRAEIEAKAAELEKLDPIELLKKRNLDPVQWAREQIIKAHNDKLQLEQLTPEDRAKKAMDEERAKLEADKKAWEEDRRKAEVAENSSRFQELLEQNVPTSLQAVGLPSIPIVAEEFNQNLRAAVAVGKELSPELIKRVAEKTSEDLREGFSSIAKKLKGEQLVAFLGQDVADELRRHDIKVWKKKRGQKADPERQNPSAPAKPAPSYIDANAALKELKHL